MARYTGFTKDQTYVTTDFAKFGAPSKNQEGAGIPGSWTYMGKVDGKVVNFKAPYADLTQFNGIKVMYRDEQINGQQADWFQLMDAVKDAADVKVKVDAKKAIEEMEWA